METLSSTTTERINSVMEQNEISDVIDAALGLK